MWRGALNFPEVLVLGERSVDDHLGKIEEQLDCHDPISIQFTSGTTGSPQGRRVFFTLQPLEHCVGHSAEIAEIITKVIKRPWTSSSGFPKSAAI